MTTRPPALRTAAGRRGCPRHARGRRRRTEARWQRRRCGIIVETFPPLFPKLRRSGIVRRMPLRTGLSNSGDCCYNDAAPDRASK